MKLRELDRSRVSTYDLDLGWLGYHAELKSAKFGESDGGNGQKWTGVLCFVEEAIKDSIALCGEIVLRERTRSAMVRNKPAGDAFASNRRSPALMRRKREMESKAGQDGGELESGSLRRSSSSRSTFFSYRLLICFSVDFSD